MRTKAPNSKSKKRLSLLLTARDQERLQRLTKVTNATSQTETIREALLVYEEIVSRLMLGHVIYTKLDHNPSVELNILIDIEAQNNNCVSVSTATTKSQRSIKTVIR